MLKMADELLRAPKWQVLHDPEEGWGMSYTHLTQSIYDSALKQEHTCSKQHAASTCDCKCSPFVPDVSAWAYENVTTDGCLNSRTIAAVRHAILALTCDIRHIQEADFQTYITNICCLCRLLDNQVTIQPWMSAHTRLGGDCCESRIDPLVDPPQRLLDYARYLWYFVHFTQAQTVEDLPSSAGVCQFNPMKEPYKPCHCIPDYWLLKLSFCPLGIWEATFDKEWEAWSTYVVMNSCHAGCQSACYAAECMPAAVCSALQTTYIQTKRKYGDSLNFLDKLDKMAECFEQLCDKCIHSHDKLMLPPMIPPHAGGADFNFPKLGCWLSAAWLCDAMGWHHEVGMRRMKPHAGNSKTDILASYTKVMVWVTHLRDLETCNLGFRVTPTLAGTIVWEEMKLGLWANGLTINEGQALTTGPNMITWHSSQVKESTLKLVKQRCDVYRPGPKGGETDHMEQHCQKTKKRASITMTFMNTPLRNVQLLAQHNNRLAAILNNWKDEGMKTGVFLDNDLEQTPGVFPGNLSATRWMSLDDDGTRPLTLWEQFSINSICYPDVFWRLYNRANIQNAQGVERRRQGDLFSVGDYELCLPQSIPGVYLPGTFPNELEMIKNGESMQGANFMNVTIQSKQYMWVGQESFESNHDHTDPIIEILAHDPTFPSLALGEYKKTEDTSVGDGYILMKRPTRADEWKLDAKRRKYGLTKIIFTDLPDQVSVKVPIPPTCSSDSDEESLSFE